MAESIKIKTLEFIAILKRNEIDTCLLKMKNKKKKERKNTHSTAKYLLKIDRDSQYR